MYNFITKCCIWRGSWFVIINLIVWLSIFLGLLFGLVYQDIQQNSGYVPVQAEVLDSYIGLRYCCSWGSGSCQETFEESCSAKKARYEDITTYDPTKCSSTTVPQNLKVRMSNITSYDECAPKSGYCGTGYRCCAQHCSTCTSCSSDSKGQTSCHSYTCNCYCIQSVSNEKVSFYCGICYKVFAFITYQYDGKYLSGIGSVDFGGDYKSADDYVKNVAYPSTSTMHHYRDVYVNPNNPVEFSLYTEFHTDNWAIFGVFTTVLFLFITFCIVQPWLNSEITDKEVAPTLPESIVKELHLQNNDKASAPTSSSSAAAGGSSFRNRMRNFSSRILSSVNRSGGGGAGGDQPTWSVPITLGCCFGIFFPLIILLPIYAEAKYINTVERRAVMITMLVFIGCGNFMLMTFLMKKFTGAPFSVVCLVYCTGFLIPISILVPIILYVPGSSSQGALIALIILDVLTFVISISVYFSCGEGSNNCRRPLQQQQQQGNDNNINVSNSSGNRWLRNMTSSTTHYNSRNKNVPIAKTTSEQEYGQPTTTTTGAAADNEYIPAAIPVSMDEELNISEDVEEKNLALVGT
jgi:hypothetical protein